VPGYALEGLLLSNDVVEVCCFAAKVLHFHKGGFLFETHADRGDVARPELYVHKWKEHAPIGTLPFFVAMAQLCGVMVFFFHQACFGSEFLAPTDFHVSGNAAAFFQDIEHHRTSRRDQPKKAAGWVDGMLHSREKQEFPPRLCTFIASRIVAFLEASSLMPAAVAHTHGTSSLPQALLASALPSSSLPQPLLTSALPASTAAGPAGFVSATNLGIVARSRTGKLMTAYVAHPHGTSSLPQPLLNSSLPSPTTAGPAELESAAPLGIVVQKRTASFGKVALSLMCMVLQLPVVEASTCVLPVHVSDKGTLFALKQHGVVGTELQGRSVTEATRAVFSALHIDKDLAFGCGTLGGSGAALSVFAAPIAFDMVPDGMEWFRAADVRDALVYNVCGVVAHSTSRAGYGHESGDMSLGKWHGARRVVSSRRGRLYADEAADQGAAEAWADLERLDELWCEDLRAALAGDDIHPGAAALAHKVTGMVGYADELPIPLQGPPSYADRQLLLTPSPTRTPIPSVKCLHSVPPQRDLFGDNGPSRWCSVDGEVGVLTTDGAHCLIGHIHAERDWAFACLDAGSSSHGTRRPTDTILGDGMFEHLKLADGVGSMPACANIWYIANGVSQPVLYDWSTGFNATFNAEDLIEWLGGGDELLCMQTLRNGCLPLGADAPRHLRLLRNNNSYGDHIVKVGEDIIEFAKKGRYEVRAVVGRDEEMTLGSACPFNHLPAYSTGTTAVPKPANPEEIRRCNDKTGPYPDGDGEPPRERNRRGGKPDGAEVVPHSLLTGNSKLLSRELRLYPPEDKTSTTHIIGTMVWPKHCSARVGIPLYAVKLDYSHFFYHWRMHKFAAWYSYLLVLAELDGVWSLLMVLSNVMEMGDPPSSWIAQDFVNRYDEQLKMEFDPISDALLLEEPQLLQDMVAERRAKIGYAAGRLFDTSTYTDDQISWVLGARRAAAFTSFLYEHAEKFRITLAPIQKLEIGTVVNPIGSRIVVSAGYICLPPIKIRKLVAGVIVAKSGKASYDEYESHCGLAAHAAQILIFERGSLHGIARPLMADQAKKRGVITMTADSSAVNDYLLARVTDTPYVPFYTAVLEPADCVTTILATSSPPCLTSDSCTGTDTDFPGSGTWLQGLWYRWAFSAFWQRFHITCLEYVGQKVGRVAMAPFLEHEPLVLNAGDNIAAQAALVQASSSPAIRIAQQVCDTDKVLRRAQSQDASIHISGVNLWFADAISRKKLAQLDSVCSALSIRHTCIGVSANADALVAALEVAFIFQWRKVPFSLPAPSAKGGTRLVTFQADSHIARSQKRARPAWVEGVGGLVTAARSRSHCGVLAALVSGTQASMTAQTPHLTDTWALAPPKVGGWLAVAAALILCLGLMARMTSERSGKAKSLPHAPAKAARSWQSRNPQPCTSQGGHRWLAGCRYEPPRCGAAWCGQVGCDVAMRCDCADPQAQDDRTASSVNWRFIAVLLAALAMPQPAVSATHYGSVPGEQPRVIDLGWGVLLDGTDAQAVKWYYETPLFYPPRVMPTVAEAVAALDTYMYDVDGRYDFAVRAVEYAALGEDEHEVRPRAYWRELSARQLRPIVLSGAARIFYVAEVEPVDNPFESDPITLDWEDFCPAGPTTCDLCGDCLAPGEGTCGWAGTDMHVCEHHEYALCPPTMGGRYFTHRSDGGQRTHCYAQHGKDSDKAASWVRKRKHHLRPAAAGGCALAARRLLHTILVTAYDSVVEVIRYVAFRDVAPSPIFAAGNLTDIARDPWQRHMPPGFLPSAPCSTGHSRAPARTVAVSSLFDASIAGATAQSSVAVKAGGSAPTDYRAQPAMKVASLKQWYASEKAGRFADDTSPFALFQGNPDRARATMEGVAATTQTGKKKGTEGKEDWALAWWQRACEWICTPWRRNDTAAYSSDNATRAAWVERETELTQGVAIFLARNVKNNVDKTISAKPGTLRAILTTARNTLSRHGCPVPPMLPLRELFNGITREYVVRHGQLALLKKRKKVLPKVDSIAMVTVADGTTIGNYVVKSDDTLWVMMVAMFTTLLNTGLRKCAVSTAHPDDLCAMLSNLTWWIAGEHVVEPTVEQMVNLPAGSYAAIVPPMGDKTDAYGDVFGSDIMYFGYDPSDVLGCARWLRLREISAPAPGRRASTPLFSPDGGSTPFTATYLDSFFRAWLATVVGPTRAAEHSLHSCRATLASALGVLKTNTDVIQALCRWKSPQSVAQYRRLTPLAYASLVKTAMATDASQAPAGPCTDDDDAMAALDAEVCEMDGAATSGGDDRAHADEGHAAPAVAAMAGVAAKKKASPCACAKQPAALMKARKAASKAAGSAVTPVRKTPKKSAAVRRLTVTAGMGVLIPRSLWPEHECAELNGRGWRGLVRSTSARKAVVKFVNARTAEGHLYEDVNLKISCLNEIDI
jgi:hypothetical protein